MDRLKRLQKALPKGMEAALVNDGANRFYLTGLRSSAGAILLTRQSAWLLIDFRYLEQAQARVHNCTVLEETDLYPQLAALLKEQGLQSLAVCSGTTTLQEHAKLAAALPGVTLDTSGALDDTINSQRACKDSQELAWHREAQRITDQVFAHICGFIRPGLTELAIAQEIGTSLTRLGSDDRTFHFIVASGKNSALPHGFATHKPVEKGDFVMMDFGANVAGRLADMTRTVALGAVTDEQRKVYNTVLEAQTRALAAIAPGRSCRDIDAAARQSISSAGYKGCFSHGLGHSLGVQVHENPRFNEKDATTLHPGHIMTVEPGVYLHGRFGVRIEDMVHITPTGCENLTHSNKQLLIL